MADGKSSSKQRPSGLPMPRHGVGDSVRVGPCDDAPGRVLEIVYSDAGLQYVVRYFHNGVAQQVRLFDDEVTA